MAESQRIDDLRRRVQKDPASIAFAQLAEECRRAGRFEESVEVCRAGLDRHPGYLSARVTVGRALIELNALDEAQTELELVLKSAPENLAAIRGLAEIHHRRGSLAEALAHYRAALALAHNDPDLQRTVADLEVIVEPKPAPIEEFLTFAEAEAEFLKNLSPPPPRPPAPIAPPPPPAAVQPGAGTMADFPLASLSPGKAAEPAVDVGVTAVAPQKVAEPIVAPPSRPTEPTIEIDLAARVADPDRAQPPAHDLRSMAAPEERLPVQSAEDVAERERATWTIVALEHWLDAIHAVRTYRSA